MATRCAPCDRLVYRERKRAKQAAREQRGRGLHVYRCPHGYGFHLGHLPSEILRGEVSKQQYFEWNNSRSRHRGYRVPTSVKRHLLELEQDGTLDALGASMAAVIAGYRTTNGFGPTWREAWTTTFHLLSTDRAARVLERHPSITQTAERWESRVQDVVMVRLHQLGWVAFDGRERSLATGAKFQEAVDRGPHERKARNTITMTTAALASGASEQLREGD